MAIQPPIPNRTRFLGVRPSDPPLLAGVYPEPGSWWYRSDLNTWVFWDGYSTSWLPVRVASNTVQFYIPAGGGEDHKHIIIDGPIGYILYVVHVEVVRVEPPQADIYTPIHWNVDVTTIGVTVGAASSIAGTTVWVEALCMGYR